MCMFCASVPVAAAIGAKLNADQNRSETATPKPIPLITAGVIALLMTGSVIYHTQVFK
jgi:hypothetical protein